MFLLGMSPKDMACQLEIVIPFVSLLIAGPWQCFRFSLGWGTAPAAASDETVQPEWDARSLRHTAGRPDLATS